MSPQSSTVIACLTHWLWFVKDLYFLFPDACCKIVLVVSQSGFMVSVNQSPELIMTRFQENKWPLRVSMEYTPWNIWLIYDLSCFKADISTTISCLLYSVVIVAFRCPLYYGPLHDYELPKPCAYYYGYIRSISYLFMPWQVKNFHQVGF